MHIRSTVFLYFCESSNSKLLDCTVLFFLFSLLLVLAVVHISFSPSFLFRDVESAMMRLRRGKNKSYAANALCYCLTRCIRPRGDTFFSVLFCGLSCTLISVTILVFLASDQQQQQQTNKKQEGRRKPDENTSFSIPWLEALFFMCVFFVQKSAEKTRKQLFRVIFLFLCVLKVPRIAFFFILATVSHRLLNQLFVVSFFFLSFCACLCAQTQLFFLFFFWLRLHFRQ